MYTKKLVGFLSIMLINSNALPIETSYTSLDVFESPQLLVNSDGSFEQKTGPLYAPNGPTLWFEVKIDGTTFIDLENIYLDVKCEIVKADNTHKSFIETEISLNEEAKNT